MKKIASLTLVTTMLIALDNDIIIVKNDLIISELQNHRVLLSKKLDNIENRRSRISQEREIKSIILEESVKRKSDERYKSNTYLYSSIK